MAPNKKRDETKEQQWQRWIRLWRASGLSVRAFCARHGLTEPSFYAWRRVLQQRAAEPTAFLPVQVVADPLPAPASVLEVVLAQGRTVRVVPGFDPATLRELVRVLEEGPPC
jgi:transposase